MRAREADSAHAWWRLAAAFAISTVGNSGMWIPQTVLPLLQAEFGIGRAGASIPYTVTMVGIGVGTILMGRLADRYGVFLPLLSAALALGLGYAAAGSATSLEQFALAQGVLIAALGCSVTFGPLIADISLWFRRRLGLAVAIAATGNYLSGAIWPPIVQYAADAFGWRAAYYGVGMASVLIIVPLALVFRTRPPESPRVAATAASRAAEARPLGLAPNTLMLLLMVAGVGCCIAMSMPQVHIVAYCADLGYGPARGAEMLSMMLGFGMVSRLASGWIADRIGGLWTLALGVAGQFVALALFLPFNGLASLYAISIFFGLVQGGIVSTYPVIVREHFEPRGIATRVSLVFTATLAGMAIGGWASGAIFDLTGSYRWAFAHGMAWNLVNLAIIGWLIARTRGLEARRTAMAQ